MVSPSHNLEKVLSCSTMKSFWCLAVLVSFLLHLQVSIGTSHGNYWYDPSNWALGWQVCSLDRQSIRSTGTTFSPDELPNPQASFTDEELRARLSEEEYWVTQRKGTEEAWSGHYIEVEEDGVYRCIVCGAELFGSDTKYESGCGWPSFKDVAKNGNVLKVVDKSHNEVRTEVVCAKCGAHLGHVFDDGPEEEETDTGVRYCINSVSLSFQSQKQNIQDLYLD